MCESNVKKETLLEFYSYDKESGLFRHAKARKGVSIGEIAGGKDGNGYLQLSVNGERIKAHRAAWVFIYGNFPDGLIDHIDGCKTNNRISNLRLATRILNGQNQRKGKNNSSSSFIGVSKCKNRWKSQIVVNGKQIFLGRFNSEIDAHNAYINAKRKYHPFCTI